MRWDSNIEGEKIGRGLLLNQFKSISEKKKDKSNSGLINCKKAGYESL